MKFSIIIPVYNVAPYLRECLNSVVKAAEQVEKRGGGGQWSVEVICVDDGSTDGSAEILDEYAARFNLSTLQPFNSSTFRVVHQENAGVSAARNAGIPLATGEYVWFVDGDDEVHPKSLEYFAKIIDSSGGTINVLHCAWARSNEWQNELDGFHPSRSSRFVPTVWMSLIRRSAIGDLQFEELRTCEDVKFVVTLTSRIDPDTVVDTKAPLYFYRTRSDSLTHATIDAKYIFGWIAAYAAIWDVIGAMPKGSEYREACSAYLRHSSLVALGGVYVYRLRGSERGKVRREYLVFLRRVSAIAGFTGVERLIATLICLPGLGWLGVPLLAVPVFIRRKFIRGRK